VALKELLSQHLADPNFAERFVEESRLAGAMSHSSIVTVHEFFEHDGVPYIAMEYLPRGSLRPYVGRLGVAQIVGILESVLAGLSHGESQGIVHRDLKPENVLVTPDDRLVITDFGTARLEGARRLTWKHLSEILGTPDYMSPEQVQGERGDDRSDIYAWGVMMYELLTGRVPFQGDNSLAVMAGHMQGVPKPVRKLRHDVSPALEAVVMHAMRRYPENRYQTAREIVEDLDHLDSLDPSAYDLSPERPMGGMAAADSARRLWAWVALISVSFVAVVVLIVVLSIVLR
jgi:serine/threonine-protein kinase